ncbi:MAG: AlbA family DNA-binding domain-containing protein [Armatimonadota bacterium]
MINMPFEQITFAYIQELVDNQVAEGRTLDYKQAILPERPAEKDRVKFLRDVAAFANTAGGDILFGIAEGSKSGIPAQPTGIGLIDVDAEIRRLESIVRDNIEPRIPRIQFKAIAGPENGPILLMHIPKSWIGPHMITHGERENNRFYARGGTANHPMDIGEIRTAFSLSENISERLRRFRADRIATILSDESPSPLKPGPKIILHLVPLNALVATATLDVTEHIEQHVKLLQPLRGSGQTRYNFDGYIMYRDEGYVLITRSGVIEAVDTEIIGYAWEENGRRYMDGKAIEGTIVNAVTRFASAQQAMAIDPPIVAMLTLLGVQGYGIVRKYDDIFYGGMHYPIEKNDLLFTEEYIEEYTTDYTPILQSIFNTLWRAAGWRNSPYYGEDGEWKLKLHPF